jgi:hypothetical protein
MRMRTRRKKKRRRYMMIGNHHADDYDRYYGSSCSSSILIPHALWNGMGPQRTLVNFWLIFDLKHTKPHFTMVKIHNYSILLRILSLPLTIKGLCRAFFADNIVMYR